MIDQDLKTIQRIVDSAPIALRKSLQKCSSITVNGTALLIICPENPRTLEEQFLARALCLRHKQISEIAYGIGEIEEVILFVGTEYFASIPTKQFRASNIMINVPNEIIRLPDRDLENEVRSHQGSASIIRMEDSKGLFANDRIHEGSGAKRNDWIGVDMRRYWIDGELKRYLEALNGDRILSGFSYIAPFFNGQLHRFVVDARLVWYGGDLCRLVKVVNCIPHQF